MPSPRERLLQAVADCLRRIRKAGGYNTDAGARVTLEPAPMVEGDADFIAVGWTAQRRTDEPAKARTHRLTDVAVVAKVRAEQANAQAALDAIVSDIEQAMDDQQFRYPVGYDTPRYQSAEPLATAFGAGWIGVTLTYTSHIPVR